MARQSERSEGYPAGRSDMAYEMSRLFDDFFQRSARGWTSWNPRADLYETEDEYVLELDLPGFDREDIDITLEQGILTIAGERSRLEEGRGRTYRVRERSRGRFTRSFSLPRSIDARDVDASFRSGVLQITLPKMPEAKPRRIEVSVNRG